MIMSRGTRRLACGFRGAIRTLLDLRSLLVAAGVAALIGIAAIPVSAAADCVYSPGGYRGADYYWTDSDGNSGNVYQNYSCSVFDMSRGNLGPSYQYWRGWLKQSSGGWYTNGYHYDGTSGVGVLLESDVQATTYEHAQVSSSSSWRNQEYH